MLDKIPQIPISQVQKIKFINGELYDLELSRLGYGLEIFLVINPATHFFKDLLHLYNFTFEPNTCTIISYKDTWLAKVFTKDWNLLVGYKFIEIDIENKFTLDRPISVVFISYKETNAEENWKRVLEKAPWAKRIHGVKGILEAHKQAAEISETEILYVVDGDSYLVDDWTFDYIPDLLSKDTTHVWKSINPINDLVYGYGGVKLFPRKNLLEAENFHVDMTTNLAYSYRSMDTVSNITAFNTDPFNTWRSAFRECAKLAASEIHATDKTINTERLDRWCSEDGKNRPFGEYCIRGAKAGRQFGNLNKKDLKLINDLDWLKNKYNENN